MNSLAQRVNAIWLANHNDKECEEFAAKIAEHLKVNQYEVHIMLTNLTCLFEG